MRKTDMELFHEQIWNRYVRMPYGHVLDYAGSDGRTVIPLKEECDRILLLPHINYV